MARIMHATSDSPLPRVEMTAVRGLNSHKATAAAIQRSSLGPGRDLCRVMRLISLRRFFVIKASSLERGWSNCPICVHKDSRS